MTTISDEEIAWIDRRSDRSPDLYFETFDISDKQRGPIRYLRQQETFERVRNMKETKHHSSDSAAAREWHQ